MLDFLDPNSHIAATEEFDAENSDAVASEPEEVAAMLAAWPASHLQKLTTQAKLKKQASLGPSQLQEARTEAARLSERTRKANRKNQADKKAERLKAERLKAEKAEREKAERVRAEQEKADRLSAEKAEQEKADRLSTE